MSRRVDCGRDYFTHNCEIVKVNDFYKKGYIFVIIPLALSPTTVDDFNIGSLMNERSSPLLNLETVLSKEKWFQSVVGRVSDWIDCDSSDESVRRKSEAALNQELLFSAYINLLAVVVPLRSRRCANLARVINDYTFSGPNQMLWMLLPLDTDEADYDDDDSGDESDVQNGSNSRVAREDQNDSVPKSARNAILSSLNFSTSTDKTQSVPDVDAAVGDATPKKRKSSSWQRFKVLHALCDRCPLIGVCLVFSSTLPPEPVLLRWLAEPVKCVFIPTYVFLINPYGFPVLPRSHQSFVQKLIKIGCQFVVSGPPIKGKPERLYALYLKHLANTLGKPDLLERWAMDYSDRLQYPLQPLRDNLPSSIYENFEKDPSKYLVYENAIRGALSDRANSELKSIHMQVVMVVGAGRGPLVQATLNASRDSGIPVKVFAVEKNPGCALRISHIGDYDAAWRESVTVVYSDMRDWEAPEKADILVSELIGSFSDNELSPECLDGCNPYLKDDVVSIPDRYTSYVAPLQSTKLFNQIRSYVEEEKGPLAIFEIPYVVRMRNALILAPPQPLFTFEHPNRDRPISNERYEVRTFAVEADATLHGFCGYFHAHLYKEQEISILPEKYTRDMFSWFPIYIPIRDPVQLKKGSCVELQFWRRVEKKKVWYEWALTKPVPSPIHNPIGRSYVIGK